MDVLPNRMLLKEGPESTCVGGGQKTFPQRLRPNNSLNAKKSEHMSSLRFHKMNTFTYLSICQRSDTCERAGVPETAKDESRGKSDTISLK